LFKSLGTRFLLGVIPILAVSFTVIVGGYEWLSFLEAKEQLKRDFEHLTASQSIILGEPIAFKDKGRLGLLLATVISTRDVAGVAVYDDEGKELDTFGRLEIRSSDLHRRVGVNFAEGDKLRRVGELFIIVSTDRLNAETRLRVIYEIILVLSLLLFGTVGVLIAHRRIVMKPIGELRDSIQRTHGGDLRLTVAGRSGDEIGELITAYNDMLSRLAVHEEALKASEARFRDFAASASDWYWETDAEHRFTYMSENIETITGTPRENFYGAKREDFCGTDHDRAAWDEHRRALDAHEPFRDFEYRRTVNDEPGIWIRTSGVPVFDDTGRFMGYRGSASDITEKKKSERLRDEALDEAERASQAKSEFLASMSHELRTPLNAILGFAQMLRIDPEVALSQRQKEHVRHILDGGGHLLELISEILDLAKIESNQLDLSIEAFAVDDIVADCVSLSAPLGEKRRIRIDNNLNGGSPSSIRSDRLRFKQVLLNLLANAVKFNVEGGSVTIDGEETVGGYFRISVTDTGVGISQADQAGVFKMFNRVGADPMTAREGTGIGLTVTKALVEQMAGTIGFESELDIGSTFWFELPLSTNRKVLIWTTDLEVGIDAIDKDHQQLTLLINRLNAATDDDRFMEGIVEDLVAYTHYHFRREEMIMGVCGFPDLQEHRSLHREFSFQMTRIVANWRQGHDAAVLKRLQDFLLDWWADHIKGRDRDIVQYTVGKDEAIRKVLDSLR